MDLDRFIEAILFFKAEPLSVSKLSAMLGKSVSEVEEALSLLEEKLEKRGLVLIRRDELVLLGTHPKASGFVEGLAKEELSKDLGKAGLETLTIVLYRAPVKRADIDYIRGVNSSFILRNLTSRGLIEKITNPKDQRGYIYKPTLETLSYLGIRKVEDLPEYAKVREEIEKFERRIQELDARE
jgi:segregation and condensation protein B